MWRWSWSWSWRWRWRWRWRRRRRNRGGSAMAIHPMHRQPCDTAPAQGPGPHRYTPTLSKLSLQPSAHSTAGKFLPWPTPNLQWPLQPHLCIPGGPALHLHTCRFLPWPHIPNHSLSGEQPIVGPGPGLGMELSGTRHCFIGQPNHSHPHKHLSHRTHPRLARQPNQPG